MHKDCINFRDGWCHLKDKEVPPDGEACDQFERKIGGEKNMVGRGFGGGFAEGPGGYCICNNCGYREPHQYATPCPTKNCPKCGTSLLREI